MANDAARSSIVGPTWRYAILGGLASIPFTVGGYMLAGSGSELSLNLVIIAGVLAGYLAPGSAVDLDGVGFRAGLIGGIPGLWLLVDFLATGLTSGGPLAFRVVAAILAGGSFAVLLLVLAGIVGVVGARIGGWIAPRNRSDGLSSLHHRT